MNTFSTEYGVDSGTSMAAAQVAGTAALFKAENPHATPQQIIDMTLKSSSKPTTNCNWVTSQGNVDILKEPLLLENVLYLILYGYH